MMKQNILQKDIILCQKLAFALHKSEQ